MITLTKGYDEWLICFTGKVLAEAPPAFYYFKFTNRTTLDEVDMWLVAEQSGTDRYELCFVNTNEYFSDYPEGFWTYEIYPSDTDQVLPTEAMIESGLMYLYPQTEFTPTKYDEQNNTFVVYNGQ
jgi:hypothetical protein